MGRVRGADDDLHLKSDLRIRSLMIGCANCCLLLRNHFRPKNSNMPQVFRCVIFLCLLPSVVPLLCYTCVFPSISPLDCLKFPTRCPLGQVCLSSKAVGQRGDLEIVLYEKSCALPVLCGLTGEKFAMGLNFTFTSDCCDTLLCNGGTATSAFIWSSTLLSLVLTMIYAQ